MTTNFPLMIYSNFRPLIIATFYQEFYNTLKETYTKKLAHSILASLNWNKSVDEEREVTICMVLTAIM
jgi:hypothetical protein